MAQNDDATDTIVDLDKASMAKLCRNLMVSEQPRAVLKPKEEIEGIISASYKKRHEKRNAAEAAAEYSLVREMRHDLWLHFMTTTGLEFKDRRVYDLVREIIESGDDRQWYSVPTMDLRKTPDLLQLHEGAVYIGDVAVSNHPESTRSEKRQKYATIANMFIASGFVVKQVYFVVAGDLSNVHAELRKIEDYQLKTTSMIPRVAHLYSCEALMAIRENCTEKALMMRILAADRTAQVTECPVPDYWPDAIFDPVVPAESEDELIRHLKNYTKQNLDTYFDSGYGDAEKAFVELWKALSDKPEESYMRPRATIPVVYNCNDYEEKTGHSLINDYIDDIDYNCDDSELRSHILGLLPGRGQIRAMVTKTASDKQSTYGEWQYKQDRLTTEIGRKMTQGLSFNKSNPNIKKAARSIHPEYYDACQNKIEAMIEYLSKKSSKPTTFAGGWMASSQEEKIRSMATRIVFEQVCQSNAAQLCLALNSVCQRLNHLPATLGQKTNIIVPPNGAFLFIMMQGHSTLSDSKCAIPFVTLCRYPSGADASHLEYDYKLATKKHDYYLSKLSRLPMSKVTLWDQSDFTSICTISALVEVTGNTMDDVMLKRTIGILTVLMLDSHQKTSELLELVKYVSFMPFANASRLSKFIKDKMNILTKTALDIWVLRELQVFMTKLSTKVMAQKRRTMVSMGRVTEDSFGMEVNLPSFMSDFQHKSIRSFTEEIAVLFNIRGKKLYGSQFMDKALTASVDYEIKFREEVEKYGKWITEGVPNYPGEEYPFDSLFAFSSSAIAHAVSHVEKEYPIDNNKALRDLASGDINAHLIHSSTLRGSLKEKDDRKTAKDFGSTSLDEGLKFLAKHNYNEELTTTHQIAHHAISKPNYVAQYSMSEKEQRGGGRPIATPTYMMKAVNMCIERPEQALGKQYRNNIIVPGLNKLLAQSNAYRDHMQKTIQGKKQGMIFHATEDQTKFSETDNTYKYGIYLKNSTTMPLAIRKLQYKCMEKMIGREHLVRHMPRDINDDIRRPYVNLDGNGVKLTGGWPQGMLNAISTTLHSQCDYYSLYLFRKAYSGLPIEVTGLVHSDDSWFVMTCDSIDVFKRYMIFRTGLKRMFCLKLNDKKFWASSILGELVSNFNNNGDVSVPIMKTVNSGTLNLLYQSFPMDMATQISTLQQLLRNGASNNVLIIMWTVLRQQVIKCYNIKINDDSWKYPIELGGVPSAAAYELALTGVTCHYNYIYDYYIKCPNDPITTTILKILNLSKMVNRSKMERAMIEAKLHTSKYKYYEPAEIESFNSINLLRRNEVFSAITQLMPKTKKVEKTVSRVMAIPFETDGLEMLVTRPKSIKIALGHIKAKLPTLLFEYATENYTSSARRMASVQAIRAKGRNYRLLNSAPITREELVDHVQNTNIRAAQPIDLKVAFNDDTGIVDIAHHTVFNSMIVANNAPKKYKLNKFPNFSNSFDVIGSLRDCLLWGLSSEHPTAAEYISRRFSDSIMKKDFETIKKRFAQFFVMYTTRQACEYIVMMSWDAIKSRLFIQPASDTTTLPDFISSMYGNIVDPDKCNDVIIDYRHGTPDITSNAIICTIHSAYVMNALYPEVVPASYDSMPIRRVLDTVDYAYLTKHNTIRRAILGIILGDNSMMDKLYENREVSHRWLRAQKRIRGKWEGEFSWIAHYQGLHMKVEGCPGDVTVTVSSPDVDKMLHMMKFLVDDSFKEYGYRDAGGWSHKTDFWITKMPRQFMRLYADSVIQTRITSGYIEGGLDILVDPNLRAIVNYSRELPESYTLDANNTKVFAQLGGKSVLVARVPQTIIMPNARLLAYKFRKLQGIGVHDLMETNILVDLTVGRRITPTNAAVIKMLQSADFDFRGIGRNFIRCMCNAVKKTSFEMEIVDVTAEEEDKKEMRLVPEKITDIIETAMVNPEDAGAVYMEEIEKLDTDVRQGGFKVIKSILHSICVNEYLDKKELCPERLINTYASSTEFIDVFQSINDEDDVETAAYEMSMQTLMKIFANSLNEAKQWDVDVVKWITSHLPPSPQCLNFLRTIVRPLVDEESARSKALKILSGECPRSEVKLVSRKPMTLPSDDESDDDFVY